MREHGGMYGGFSWFQIHFGRASTAVHPQEFYSVSMIIDKLDGDFQFFPNPFFKDFSAGSGQFGKGLGLQWFSPTRKDKNGLAGFPQFIAMRNAKEFGKRILFIVANLDGLQFIFPPKACVKKGGVRVGVFVMNRSERTIKQRQNTSITLPKKQE